MTRSSSKIEQFTHEPVLRDEVLQGLELTGKDIIVDGTLGLGGHARIILESLGPKGKLVGFDLDKDNLKTAKINLKEFGKQVTFVHANFSALADRLKKLKIKKIDGILLDLGISSVHVDMADKGFSFLKEGPLDMRYDEDQPATAADVVNKYSQKELIRIFREYGEERHAKKIADAILYQRRRHPFETTLDLARCVEKLLKREGHLHPATRIFQALRIEVNHELDVLVSVLQQVVSLLREGGRLVVISYHSLEDRIVKQFFFSQARDFINLPDQLMTTHLEPALKIITKKPLVPTPEEIRRNPRSRSAKLRIAEKL